MLDESLRTSLKSLYAETGPERFGYINTQGFTEFTNNVHPDPENGFEASEEDLDLMFQDKTVYAIWHTQPGRTSQLSYEDYMGFINFPEYKHIVIGADGLRVYRAEHGSVVKDALYLND